MGALIVCVAIAVVRIETAHDEPAAAGERLLAAAGKRQPQPEPEDQLKEHRERPEQQEKHQSGQLQKQQQQPQQAAQGGPLAQWPYPLHLGFCALLLTVAMLLWGVSQEFVMTNVYFSGGQAERISSPVFLVLCNRLVTIVFAGVVLRLRGMPLLFEGFMAGASPAVTNTIASLCQYQSLAYVSFTLQTSFKSAKLIPVLILSSIRGQSHTEHDYMESAVIVIGLSVFAFESEGHSHQAVDSTTAGVLLLVGLLLCDACTPHLQDAMFKRYQGIQVIQATFSMSCWAAGALLLILLSTGELTESIALCARHPEVIVHITVLSLSSTVTQFMISYTVKHFGPVVFTVIASTRQVISVCISAILFGHDMSDVAVLAVAVIFTTVLVRAIRPRKAPSLDDRLSDSASAGGSSTELWTDTEQLRPLLLCGVALHVLYCFHAVNQEFLATHTFDGHIFAFPVLLVAVGHTSGAAFAVVALKLQGLPIFVPQLGCTILPMPTSLVATCFEHKALYSMYFPAQTLMKTLKVVPVMLIGRLLKNRTYTPIDYLEGTVITTLATLFVWSYQTRGSQAQAAAGIGLMLVYVVVDPFTSNLEDLVYQLTNVDPGQMLFGMELSSSACAWLFVLVDGQAGPAISFIRTRPDICLNIALFAFASAAGAYTCELTVRLFGPVIFTLLMMSRCVMSLVISVIVFQHDVGVLDCILLGVVSVILLSSCLRRASAQLAAKMALSRLK